VTNFVYYLKELTSSGGDEMIKSFNQLVTARKVTVFVDADFESYSGCRIKDGVYQIIFRPGDFGTNVSYCNSNMQKEIDKAMANSTEVLISLTAKLSIRDNFEAKKADLKKEIDSLLKESYSIEVDFSKLYTEITESWGKENMGSVAADSISDFIYYLKNLSQEGENETVVKNFNEIVSSRKISVVVDENFDGYYSGCRVRDGVYQIVFKPGSFGTNLSGCNQNMLKELDIALFASNSKALPLVAKLSIANDFEAKKAEVAAKIAEELGGEKFSLMADFDKIWAAIVSAKDALPRDKKSEIDLEWVSSNMGSSVFEYFSSLAYYLNYQFKGDEMCIEEFVGVVSTKEVWFEIVPEGNLSESRSYNDLVFQDGKAILRTIPRYFGTNISDTASDIMKAIS
jgi:hypothetical protein